jgi:HEAT repeat protein
MTTFYRYCCVVILVSISLVSSLSKAQSTETILKRHFDDVRSGRLSEIPSVLLQEKNASILLRDIHEFLGDTLSSIRSTAYTIIQRLGINSNESSIRYAVVHLLIEGCKDHDNGNAGTSLAYLTSFKKGDFNAVALDSIRSQFKNKPPHLSQIIKLIGFLALKDLQEEIRTYSQAGNPRQLRWAAIISLARMGDATALQEMMTRVKKLPVNDDVVYEVFPDLAYTRQREAINYIVEVMQQEAKNCMSADAEREEAIVCGYRIMEQLAPVVEGYPLALDKSGDIQTNDYVTALRTVRQWFNAHVDYKLKTDTY